MLATIKALGIQEKAQYFAFFNIFLVGLPTAYVFVEPLGFGINGLWYGMIIGLGLNFIGYIYLVLQSDWREISENCQDEMDKELLLIEKSTKGSSTDETDLPLDTESNGELDNYFHPYAT